LDNVSLFLYLAASSALFVQQLAHAATKLACDKSSDGVVTLDILKSCIDQDVAKYDFLSQIISPIQESQVPSYHKMSTKLRERKRTPATNSNKNAVNEADFEQIHDRKKRQCINNPSRCDDRSQSLQHSPARFFLGSNDLNPPIVDLELDINHTNKFIDDDDDYD